MHHLIIYTHNGCQRFKGVYPPITGRTECYFIIVLAAHHLTLISYPPIVPEKCQTVLEYLTKNDAPSSP